MNTPSYIYIHKTDKILSKNNCPICKLIEEGKLKEDANGVLQYKKELTEKDIKNKMYSIIQEMKHKRTSI